ncbi:Gfo/Idh/MocA family protein [Paenibacillus ginsengarvi]|uniref:Gfo/Idh/MocA family oxidoreductase n=1 Tax=Paenibacillus ginsengarvi TaxID=400777 RepID=A0A3B0CBS0_9BACL|nr:Gfo/Idh/MocA family oxidoreductase [Paenibacillus ginsengarvi]RKN83855.1 gfo/Idh/MocA family oxidoreductase [Paenibacillus ginsengarvi]
MEKIRLGIIGCGNIAGSHIGGMMQLGDLMEVTAVCDIVLERAQQAADKLGSRLAVADYKDLVDDVDAVLISLPHDLHFPVGMYFLQAGKHVLMEKPLCNTEEECLQLIETAERYERVLMTAYPVRYWPAIVKIKEWLDNKTYGEPFQLSIWTEQYTKYPEGHWGMSAERLGGGQFFSHGCHYVDLMLWLLGEPVRGCHIGTNLGTPWMEKEGTSNVVLEFASGAMGYHMGTWGARGTRLGWSLHIHCTHGMIEYKRTDGKVYLHHSIKEEKANLDSDSKLTILYEDSENGKLTQHEARHFLECIANKKRPLTDGYSSLQGLRIIWKLYEAERQHTMADLLGLGLPAY